MAILPREGLDQQGELDILVRGQDRDEVVELKDVPDACRPPPRELAAGELRDVDPFDLELT